MLLVFGQQLPMDRTLESAEEPNLKAIAFDTVQNYVIEPAESRGEIQRIEQPIIHFTTYGIDEGNIFLWTERGRPALAGQVFRLKNVEKGLWIHEFQSLRTKPFTLSRDGREIWKPKSAGIEWRTLTTDLIPSETERGRLTQFKQLARDFSGVQQTPGLDEGSSTKEFVLTMKPREAYRYQSKANQILDGVMFYFTHEENRDPELLLLIEVASDATRNSWQFALARMSCWPMQVDYQGNRVADFPNVIDKTVPSDSFYVWRPVVK